MKPKNTISKPLFLIEQFLWSVVALVWYDVLLFECLPSCSYLTSRVTMLAIFFVCLAIGVCADFRRNRCYPALLQNMVIPLGLYTVMVYASYFKGFILCMGAIFFLCSVAYGMAVFRQKPGAGKRPGKPLWHRAKISLRGIRTIAALCLLVIMSFLGLKSALLGALFRADVPAVGPAHRAEWTMENRMTTLNQLKPEVWKGLSMTEKLDVLQTVANIEANYLGTEFELCVGAAPLAYEIAGEYIEKFHRITIDPEHLKNDSPRSVLNSLLHECRHGYQHSALRLLDAVSEDCENLRAVKEIQEFQYGFDHYDSINYSTNPVERDAYLYALNRTDDYLMKIQ